MSADYKEVRRLLMEIDPELPVGMDDKDFTWEVIAHINENYASRWPQVPMHKIIREVKAKWAPRRKSSVDVRIAQALGTVRARVSSKMQMSYMIDKGKGHVRGTIETNWGRSIPFMDVSSFNGLCLKTFGAVKAKFSDADKVLFESRLVVGEGREVGTISQEFWFTIPLDNGEDAIVEFLKGLGFIE